MSKFIIVAHATKSAFEPSGNFGDSGVGGSAGPTGATGPINPMTGPDCTEAIVTTEQDVYADNEFIYDDLDNAILDGNNNICVRDGSYSFTSFSGGKLHVMAGATVTDGTIGSNTILDGDGTLQNVAFNGNNIMIKNLHLIGPTSMTGDNYVIENINHDATVLTYVGSNFTLRESILQGLLRMGPEGSPVYIHDNKFEGSTNGILISDPTTSAYITNNVVEGLVTFVNIQDNLHLSNNDIGSNLTLPRSNNVKVLNNRIAGRVIITTTQVSTEMSGLFYGNVSTVFSSALTTVDYNGFKFDENVFTNGIQIGGAVSNSSFTNNTFGNAGAISGTAGTSQDFSNFIFEGNSLGTFILSCNDISYSNINNNTVFGVDPNGIVVAPQKTVDTVTINNNVIDAQGAQLRVQFQNPGGELNEDIRNCVFSSNVVNSSTTPSMLFEFLPGITSTIFQSNTINNNALGGDILINNCATASSCFNNVISGNKVNLIQVNLLQNAGNNWVVHNRNQVSTVNFNGADVSTENLVP